MCPCWKYALNTGTTAAVLFCGWLFVRAKSTVPMIPMYVDQVVQLKHMNWLATYELVCIYTGKPFGIQMYVPREHDKTRPISSPEEVRGVTSTIVLRACCRFPCAARWTHPRSPLGIRGCFTWLKLKSSFRFATPFFPPQVPKGLWKRFSVS